MRDLGRHCNTRAESDGNTGGKEFGLWRFCKLPYYICSTVDSVYSSQATRKEKEEAEIFSTSKKEVPQSTIPD